MTFFFRDDSNFDFLYYNFHNHDNYFQDFDFHFLHLFHVDTHYSIVLAILFQRDCSIAYDTVHNIYLVNHQDNSFHSFYSVAD